MAAPALHAWAARARPLRLAEQAVAKDDPDKQALACYGVLFPATNAAWLRSLDGRPRGAVTTVSLDWRCQEAAARGKRALLLVWDNASWHVSKGGPGLGARARPACQGDRGGCAAHPLPAAGRKPPAQPARAQVAAHQGPGARAGAAVRTRRACLGRPELRPPRPHPHPRTGALMLHQETIHQWRMPVQRGVESPVVSRRRSVPQRHENRWGTSTALYSYYNERTVVLRPARHRKRRRRRER